MIICINSGVLLLVDWAIEWKGIKKPCNKRHTKDKKKRMVQHFFVVLATQAITYETRPMKTRLSSLDLCFIPVMKMREEIHKSVFFSLNFWKFLRYCTAEWGTKMQTDRWAGTFIGKGDLWSCISTIIFFLQVLSVLFLLRALYLLFLSMPLCTSPFKRWTQPFMLTTLWWKLSCHLPTSECQWAPPPSWP